MFKNKNALNCFSPPVMIATFIIESIFIAALLFTRKLNQNTKLILGLLVCLASFQLAEYGICEAWGFTPTTWAKIGFSAITFLPVLGLHLVYSIDKRKLSKLVPMGYILSLMWLLFFYFGSMLKGAVCSGNYVIFAIPDAYELPYYIFYDAYMLIAIIVALMFARRQRIVKIRVALQALAIGYLAFIVPSMLFSKYDNYGGADSNLPSVMCGFALLFAAVLTAKVAPQVAKSRV